MDIQLLLVPYDTARRCWRSGAGPEHLLQAGLTTHLQARGHSVADIQVIEADPDQPPAEIGTAFELMRRIAVAVRAVRAAGRFPVVLAGNCNSAVGTLSGLTPAPRPFSGSTLTGTAIPQTPPRLAFWMALGSP